MHACVCVCVCVILSALEEYPNSNHGNEFKGKCKNSIVVRVCPQVEPNNAMNSLYVYLHV